MTAKTLPVAIAVCMAIALIGGYARHVGQPTCQDLCFPHAWGPDVDCTCFDVEAGVHYCPVAATVAP